MVAWIDAQPRSMMWTTTISEAELAFGVALLPPGQRRESLAAAISGLLRDGLRERILPFDRAAAAAFGPFYAARRASGRPMKTPDAQIAAIAVSRSAALATRDADFANCGLTLLNPWLSA